ncbi:MAG: alpha-D-ribose 1-methylphosphonate 5-triphosphate diphosphatase [Streptosporangiales bacterium]|nr:alpha-D-ribose 1-methylphosphonate 5-triphosphate diphosphatase [Streptosporangiales bacterium]
MTRLCIHNVRAVLPDRVLDDAVVVAEDGVLVDVAERAGPPPPAAVDGRGAYLLPGLVDTHSDGLEKELQPRPGVEFDVGFGLASFEGRVRAAGITTVFHATGYYGDDSKNRSIEGALVRERAIRTRMCDGQAQLDHRMLFRLDARDPDGLAALGETLEYYRAETVPPLVSYEDHTPGQGQFRDLDAYARLYLGEHDRTTAHQLMAARIAERDGRVWHREVALDWLVHRNGTVRVLGHDPVTADEVADLAAVGVAVAEFPTTLAAAHAAREYGLLVVAGAPNVLRGGSHSGNVAAADLIAEGLVDGLSSDYMPFSMIGAAFRLARDGRAPLPVAVGLVTRGAARVAGLADRGRLEVGARADLVLVTEDAGWPTVRSTWSAVDDRVLVGS